MLDVRHKKAITAEVGNRYIKTTKKDKNKILDEFSPTSGIISNPFYIRNITNWFI